MEPVTTKVVDVAVVLTLTGVCVRRSPPNEGAAKTEQLPPDVNF